VDFNLRKLYGDRPNRYVCEKCVSLSVVVLLHGSHLYVAVMLTTEQPTALKWLFGNIVGPLLLAVACAVAWFLIPLNHDVDTHTMFLLLKLFPLFFTAMLATSILLLQLVDSPRDASSKLHDQAASEQHRSQPSDISRSRLMLAAGASAGGAAVLTIGMLVMQCCCMSQG